MKGRIHSIETFGTVDGPGIRLVVFLQGCPMRCLYCHNPDTWGAAAEMERTAEEILELHERNKGYYKQGGITVSGGEAMLQIPFLIELFTKAKEKGVHTCLDTSGILFPIGEKTPGKIKKREQIDALMQVTDLILLDIKHIDDTKHKELTGYSNEAVLAFANYLDEKQVPVWIRHVAVPGITDKKEEYVELGRFLGGLSNIKAVDVLPYHTMGKVKYDALGMAYRLDGVPEMPKEQALELRKYILYGIKLRRSESK